MKKLFGLLMFFLGLSVFEANAELPIAPRWTGEITLNPDIKIKIRFNFKEDSPGKYSVTLDSPEQGVTGMPGVINSISAKGFDVAVPKISLRYTATIVDTDEGKVANGIFNQITVTTPLIMLPGDDKAVRPQTPQPPFPYTERDVSFSNPEDGTILRGTLTLPSSYYEGTPVVVLVSGSGLQNRDEEIFEHRPFAVIADYLARIGIGTLRYDDRGFGESGGDATNATTRDFALDAKGALKFLKEEMKFNKVGILGHSEGATIAFILANSDFKPDFIIGMGTPAVKGELILLEQLEDSLGKTAAKDALEKAKEDPNPWLAYFLEYDPSHDIGNTACPVLALYGDKDRQVSVKLNKDAFVRLQPDAQVIVFPDLNHLMQHCKTGKPDEYYKIEETISPEVLSEIARFIQKNR